MRAWGGVRPCCVHGHDVVEHLLTVGHLLDAERVFHATFVATVDPLLVAEAIADHAVLL